MRPQELAKLLRELDAALKGVETTVSVPLR
jgi:hypothetical protein